MPEEEYPEQVDYATYRCTICGAKFLGKELKRTNVSSSTYGYSFVTPCNHWTYLEGSSLEIVRDPRPEAEAIFAAMQLPDEFEKRIVEDDVLHTLLGMVGLYGLYSYRLEIGDRKFRVHYGYADRQKKTWEVSLRELKSWEQLAAEGDRSYDLSKMTGERLLALLHDCQKCGGAYRPYYGEDWPAIPIEAVKAALDKIGHVPRRGRATRMRKIAERRQKLGGKGKRDR